MMKRTSLDRLARLAIRVSLFSCMLAVRPGHAQSPDARPPAFDVASIRPTTFRSTSGEGSSRSLIQCAADGLTMRNIDLSEMVQWAYGLQHDQVFGGDKLDGSRYDILARTDAPVPVSTLRLMLQDLLATRYKVQLHREQKITSVYELVVAKGGPKLGKNKANTLPPSYGKESFPYVVDGGFLFSNVSMADFADQLTELRGIDLPVVNRTGIQGVFDITLKSAASAMLEPNGPSLFTLLPEQLGLKLVPAKDPVDVVVVDHAEKPSPN